MAELHSNLYYRHPDVQTMALLDSLFYESEGDSEKMTAICQSINAHNGSELFSDLLGMVDEPRYDLGAESLDKMTDYSICHFVHGSEGDELMGEILIFLYALCPDIHAQVWGCGDDDPWEYWFKYENGSLIRRDDEPEMDEGEEDKHIKDTIYRWWHESMPESIKEGFLNEIDIEDEYIVFTGKMRQGSREEMVELAQDFGAIVQKAINDETTMLLVGENPGADKLNKAEELGLKILSEADFYRLVEQ